MKCQALFISKMKKMINHCVTQNLSSAVSIGHLEVKNMVAKFLKI